MTDILGPITRFKRALAGLITQVLVYIDIRAAWGGGASTSQAATQ